jgi:hypothetical protein
MQESSQVEEQPRGQPFHPGRQGPPGEGLKGESVWVDYPQTKFNPQRNQ